MRADSLGFPWSPGRTSRPVGFFLMVLLAGGCAEAPPSTPIYATIGESLPDLTDEEHARFLAGRAVFLRQFTPETGLGPRFNENSCDACHTSPESGGTGETQVTKATRFTAEGACDPLAALGGENLRLRVTPGAIGAGVSRPDVPADATHRARFTTPFVFGSGLMDAIDQSTLDALADPDDADGDGISGRVGRDAGGRPARFGRKADIASLEDFVEGAFRLEMGVTTPHRPDETLAGFAPFHPSLSDPAADPEVDEASFGAVMDFLRFLAPPGPAVVEDEARRSEVEAGRALFSSLGCAGCHVPVLRTSPDAPTPLADRAVALYSDLLLHDMGPDLEGTCGPGAGTREWRTEPLMGLRHRRLFLHDGRVGRVMDAILAHGGEAQAARDRFVALDRLTQEALLRFLDTL